jgi:hydrogenase-4 component F
MLLLAIVCVPLATGVLAGVFAWRCAVGWATVLAKTAVVGLGVALAVDTDSNRVVSGLDGALRADALSAYMVVVIGIVSLLASIQSVRYLQADVALG